MRSSNGTKPSARVPSGCLVGTSGSVGAPRPVGVTRLEGPIFVGLGFGDWAAMCPYGHQGTAEGSSSAPGAGVGPSPALLCAGKAAGSRRRPSGVTLGQQRSLGSDPGPATNSRTTQARLALPGAPGAALWSLGSFQCGNSKQGRERGFPHTAAALGRQTWGAPGIQLRPPLRTRPPGASSLQMGKLRPSQEQGLGPRHSTNPSRHRTGWAYRHQGLPRSLCTPPASQIPPRAGVLLGPA